MMPETEYGPTVTCTGCGAEVHPLEVFPKRRCLACHEAQFTMPTSGVEVAAMFRKAVRSGRR